MVDETRDDPEELTTFEKLKGWFRADWQSWSPWYPEATEDYGFYSGEQWEAEDRAAMKAAAKPCVTFNRIGPSIDSVVGMEVSNRKEVTYLPRTTSSATQPGQIDPMTGQPTQQPVPGGDDQGPAELLTAAGQYCRDQCDAEDEESDAFLDTTICGVGWTETRVDYDDDPQGKIIVDRIDPMEMCADGRASKRNLTDARRIHRFREVDLKTAQQMFPGFEPEELDASWARPIAAGSDQPHDRELAREYASNRPSDGTPKRTVMIVHTRWYETQYTYRVAQSDGQVIDVDDDQIKVLRERAKKADITLKVQRIGKKVYRYAFLGASDVLEEGQDQCQYGFAWNCITGKRDRNKKQWIGLVRAMRDPQRWANALLSSIMNSIMHSGKGIMAERGAFEKPEQAEKDWTKADRITFLATGALSGQHPKIMPKTDSALPAGIGDMMQFAVSSIRDVTGINVEMLGTADSNQAAALDRQRKQAASMLLAPFFDGLRRYRKEQGRLMMHLICDYLNDGRLIRIVGPDYEGYAPLVIDPAVQEFDIIVDESPASPNQKEASWMILQQMLPVLLKQPLSTGAWGKLLKASPLPMAVVKDFTDQLEKDAEAQAQQGPSPEDMKLMAEAEKSKADAALKQQELQVRGVEAQLAFQGTQLELGDKAAQREHDMQMRGMELQGMEREKFASAAGAEMPAKFDALGQGLVALAQSIATGEQAIGAALMQQSQAITELAKAQMAPRVTEVADPVTGQTMTAVSRPATVQ